MQTIHNDLIVLTNVELFNMYIISTRLEWEHKCQLALEEMAQRMEMWAEAENG